MKKIKYLGTVLVLFIGIFANTAMAQTNYVWNGTTSDWATATNWSPNGIPGTNAGDTATISNGVGPTISSGSYTIARLTIANSAGTPAGSTLTIANGVILNVNSSTVTVVTLSGGNIVNNGTLAIRSANAGSHGSLTTGITCATPSSLPSGAAEFGYTGGTNSTLNIDISAAVYAGAAAVTVTAVNTLTTYKILFNGTTNISLGNALTYTRTNPAPNVVLPTNFSVFRAIGGANASKLIVGGAGFTLGSLGSPIVNGGLFSCASQSIVTVNEGTNLTLHSSASNVTSGIQAANSTNGIPTQFTNKGTINILGETLRHGLAFNITSATNGDDRKIRIVNDGVFNVDISAINPTASSVSYAALSITDPFGGVGNPLGSLVDIVNNGTLTLKNSSSAAGTGFAIWGTGVGQGAESKITNNGTLNLFSTVTSGYQRNTIFNNGIINSNGPINPSRGLINNTSGTINFTDSPANFTVLTEALATVGATYTDSNLNVYTISGTKTSGPTRLLASLTNAIAAIPAEGTLTLTGGAGDAIIAYSAVGTLANAITLSSSTVSNLNNGIISTGKGIGTNLSVISGVSDLSTGTLSPGGLTGKGIVQYSRIAAGLDATFPGVTLAGKLNIQVSGNSIAGVDYDQITNSATNGGFDISAATLEITSLYTPTSTVVIPIVVASGSGTISGTFASVIGLTPGWTVSYASPTAVILIYTVPVIPTVWTGAAGDNNFFTEANWRNSGTNLAPAANTINPGANINLHLQINNAAAVINSGTIQFGTGSLAVSSANLDATSLSGGTVTINEGGYIELSSTTPFLNNVQMNFTTGIGWIRTPKYTARAVSDNNIGQIKVNFINAIFANNLRLDHYYLNGCVIRANLAATAPLTVYDSANLVGTPVGITVNTIHSGVAIANAMNNKVESFLLKKGFMVTIANENDGTGKSKNYIASEADLVINVLPQTLQNAISFIRVMPWNWASKKGFNSLLDSNLDSSWRYQWNAGESSGLDWEFAPMSWGHTGANSPSALAVYIRGYNTPHIMSFNEPDHCEGQSGQYGNLCQTDVAVGYHKNLMKTGMRIVSPAGREEAPKTGQWLEEFYNKATAQDARIDVIAVHWYDWGSNPRAGDNATGDAAFNRFKTYLNNVYNKFGLPIWITEFNANPARSQAVNARFLELALPWLEAQPFIERYCWFPFNSGTHFTGWNDATRTPTDTTLSLVGTIYKNIDNTTPVNTTPAVPEATVNVNNNLDLSSYPNIALNKPATASSNLTTFVPSEAVDGDKTTAASRWVVDFPTAPLPAWIEVDLQGSFLVDSFRIFEDASVGGLPSRDFNFQIWDASLSAGLGGWVNALTVAGNPISSFTTYRTITPVNSTKVRLFVTSHHATDRIRMFEFEVYGSPSSPVWTGNTNTSWTTASNWSTSTVPSQFNNVLINGGATFQPTISATTTINSLTIATGATLTVTAPNFTVIGAIENNGTMSVANNSNLLQGEEFNPNSGNVTVNRNSSALNRLDYTIWSSPVENQNLAAFSPETSLNRFYNYNQTSNIYNVIASPSTTSFGLAAGHLIRMPNTHPSTPTVWNGSFTGVPNNGSISRVVTYRNEAPFNFGFNMIGNPYPSTLNAIAFITENTTKIENILYFWRKTNGALGSAYATWMNGMGGTASGAGSEIPNGTIQVGQGFFVRAKPGTNPLATSFNQALFFNNEMRLGSTSTQFFKTRQVAKDRLWLNLTTTSGVFSQVLIGYIPNATLGVDDFDGRYINDSPVALTSLINDEEYTIQSRLAFDPKDVVPLSFKTDVSGDYNIALDHFDGVFDNDQDIYLMDNLTGIETNLKAGSYTFTAVANADNKRFSIQYQKSLNVVSAYFNENNVIVYKDNGTIFVKSSTATINNIKIYDIQGRLITEKNNVNSNAASLISNALNQVLIVKITAEDNTVVAKKIVN